MTYQNLTSPRRIKDQLDKDNKDNEINDAYEMKWNIKSRRRVVKC